MLILFLLLAGLKLGLAQFCPIDVQHLHELCLELMPKNSSYSSIHEALVCGKSLKNNQVRQNLASTGLIHLFVVSGLHIQLIGRTINLLINPQKLITKFILLFSLLFYGAVCQFSPPVTRALISYSLFTFRPRWSQRTPFFYQVPLVGFFCLILQPDWVQSLSFILSWIAALMIGIPNLNLFVKNSLIYLALIFPLIEIGAPGPSSVVANIIFAPPITFLAFPMTILSSFFSGLILMSDCIWLALFKVLSMTHINYPKSTSLVTSQFLHLWAYVLIINSGVWLWQVKNLRSLYRKR